MVRALLPVQPLVLSEKVTVVPAPKLVKPED